VFPDDLYAGAIRVVVEGTLDGDLIAFAGEEVVIDGTVTGSVFAVTPSLVINGTVEGSVRATARDISVSGSVDGDLVAAAVDAQLGPESTVGGDVLVWAWSLTATGVIGGDLTGSQRSLSLSGLVEGDVEVSVRRFEIPGELRVVGDLGYRSDHVATGIENADVGGAIVHQTTLPPNLRVRALGMLSRFLVVLFLSIAALAIAYGWPERTALAVSAVRTRPVRKWLTGAVILFSPVVVAGVAAVILGLAPPTAALPLVVVLAPIVLALTGVSLALGLIAGAPSAGWLGEVVLRRHGLYGSILAGSLLAGLLWYLPWVGILVPVVLLPLGLGAWIGTWRHSSSDVASSSRSRSMPHSSA